MRGALGRGAAVCAALLALPLPLGAQSIDAAALLAKHQAYVGWHAGDGNVRTLRLTGIVTRGAKTVGSIRRLYYGYAYRRTRIDDLAVTSDDGFTGSLFWSTSANGFTVRPAGDAARFLADEDTVFGEHTGDLSAAFVRRETLDGAEVVVLRLTGPVILPLEVTVDPSTGAYRAFTIDPGGKYERSYGALAYTGVDGKHFLSTWRTGNSTVVLHSIEPNAAVGADDVHPPKQTATWSFGTAPARAEITTADQTRRAEAIVIDAAVNGVRGRFLLDTGASGTFLSEGFARRVGAVRIGNAHFGGIGPDVATATTYHVDAIAVGGSTLHDVIVHGGVFETGMKLEGVVGVIGFDLLGGALVDLDLDAGTLRVLDPAAVAPDESRGFVLHVDLSSYLMRVPMKVDERLDVLATLDTGDPLQVLFAPELVTQRKVAFAPDVGHPFGWTSYLSGVGGIEIDRCGKLGSVTLGAIAYDRVPACISSSIGRGQMLVGLDFLKHFNYVFDYPHGTVLMTYRKGS
ncbi:MAG: clan AA aspartic protease [Candidatus Eremiobacteraeota bacterium]|nr:clan AA aspartic protease [Candidatus Eremiobacteraeota bacterium]